MFALCIFNGDLGAAAAGAAVIDRPINRSAVAAAFHNIDALCTNVMIVFVISVCLFFFDTYLCIINALKISADSGSTVNPTHANF